MSEHLRMPLYGNGYALVLSAATTSALGMLYWVLAARYYSTSAVGFNSAAISAMMFLSAVTRLNLNNVLIRFLPRAGRASSRLIGWSYAASALAGTLIGLLLCLFGSRWFSTFGVLGGNPTVAVWFVVAILFWGIFVLQDGALSGLRQSKWVPIENTIFAVVKIVLLLALAHVAPTYGIFASWTIPVLLSLLPINWLIFGKLIPQHVHTTESVAQPIEMRQITSYIAGDYVGTLFSMGYSLLPSVMVLAVAGDTASAYFYLPWTIASSLQLIATNMTTSLTVEASLDRSRLALYTRRILVRTAQMLLPLIILIVAGAPLLLHVFNSNYASEGALLLRLLALAAIPNVITTLYISLARVQRRIVRVVVIQSLLCLLILGLSYSLLHTLGIVGVGVAWLASQGLLAAAICLMHLPLIIRHARSS